MNGTLGDIDRVFSGAFTLTPSPVISRSLARFSGSCSILGTIFRHDALSAVRTCVVLAQPCLDTVGVEPMTAWQDGDLASNESLVHADGAVCLSRCFIQVFLCDFLLRQRGDSFGRGRTGSVGLVLLHEL